MDLNVLKTFVAVCEYAGFSAAGEKLGYTQSTVSSQIRQLEKELNTTLFERFYHRVHLTDDGVLVLKYARKILESNERMLEELKKPETFSGEIHLAMSSSICNRYFKEDYLNFRKKYPNITLVITECGTEQMFDMLRKNETDMVFTLDNHIYDSEFVICAERQEEVHFVSRYRDETGLNQPMTLKDISSRSFVLTETNMSYREMLNLKLAENFLEIRPVLEIGNPLQICSIVRNSELISFLPDFITNDYVKKHELSRISVPDCCISVWTQLLMHKNKWISPVLNAFIEYYKEIIGKK